VLLDQPCAAAVKPDTSLTQKDQPTTPESGELVPCQASLTTTVFAIRLDNAQVLRFDQASNGKLLVQIEASEDWKNALNQTDDPKHRSPRRVVITGQAQHGVLHVDSIQRDRPPANKTH
jgi:hypothetical protein